MNLVTVTDAAGQLAVHPDTIRRLIAKGELPAVRIGRNVRIEEGELIAFVRRQQGSGEPVRVGEMSPGQRRALHAKCAALDGRLELERGESKRRILLMSSENFGKQMTSANHLNEVEAGWALDLLDEQL